MFSIAKKDRRHEQSHNDPKPIYEPYIKSLLTSKIVLSIREIGKNVKQNLERKIISQVEGKCIPEGFIRPNSVQIINYSSGNVISDLIEFHAVYECYVCHPVEGMLVEAMTKTITKAGIHAQVIDKEGNIPITVFVARDHHHIDQLFNSVSENAKIIVRVIGTRFELNDPYICVIAKLDSVDMGHTNPDRKQKPRINVLEDEM